MVSRRWFVPGRRVATAALLVAFVLPQVGRARPGRPGGLGHGVPVAPGRVGGPGYRGFYGPPRRVFYGPGFYGPGFFGLGLGLGLGYGYGYPYSYGYGYPYGYGYGYPYSYAAPVYVTPSCAAPAAAAVPAAGVAPAGGATAPAAVRLTESDVILSVRVPADAVVHINGAATTQTGLRREFITSGLAPGRSYTFDVVARWKGPKGEVIEREQRIGVQGGERRAVDFLMTGSPATLPASFRPAH